MQFVELSQPPRLVVSYIGKLMCVSFLSIVVNAGMDIGVYQKI